MKNILLVTLIITLIISVLLSCKNNTKQTDKDSSAKLTNASIQNLIQKFRPFIQGVWVKSSYIDKLSKTRSPYKSRAELDGVASMTINLPVGKVDSISIGYSLNNHEGSDFMLYSETGQMSTSLKTGLPDYDLKSNFYEFGYSINHQDTTLIFRRIQIND